MKIERREFIVTSAAALAGLAATSNPQRRGIDVVEKSAVELANMLSGGRATSVQITAGYLARIRAIDPKLNSVIEINPDALAIARERDAELRRKNIRGPLHGIPVLIKDNIDTADKMKTTAGSLALANDPAPREDAFVAKKLRDAGAVILGKTNLSEWANFRDESSSSGWSGRGGQTRNPYVLDRNPCGSSSGTGAAIAASLAAIGIGTETDGSIMCPSSINGLVGIKPTVGLVSRSGIIPISATQDTAGPMCRTVEDAALTLAAIIGRDGADPATASQPRIQFADMKAGLQGLRIGVARDYWGRNAAVDRVMNSSLETLRRLGATLIDVTFPNLNKFGDAEFLVLQYEFKDGLERYLGRRGSAHRTLDDLIRYNKANEAKELPFFGQSIFERSAKKGDLRSKEYLDALETARKLSREEGIDKVMNDNRLDAVAAPSNATTWMIDLVNGDCGSNYVSSSSMPAVAGYPNVTVPAGFARELPIGISFFGRAWSEPMLIRVAYGFEQTAKARRPPKYIASSSLVPGAGEQ